MSTDVSSATAVEAVVFPAVDLNGEAEGYTRGHAAGYAAGLRRAAADVAAREVERTAEHAAALRAGQARTDRAVAVLDAAARALATRTTPVLEEVDAQLVSAALVLAEAVVGSELSDAPHAARAALARALSGPDASAVVAVRLHPDDLAHVSSATDASGAPTVSLVADTALAPGDAVAVYPDGELDARVGTALERARSVVAEAHP
ncbi:FliH/SctL family protein [Terracoccus sp. 273MFTsu3.1]|uniref:FliH/SctL family protein n=1 Tax=Terracoccus sp. 273MFTsu3.1 TaxID=1172188 RepID=UPI00036BEB7B|nr:FliH/SctL family protein [Terracoccus sp. 273MFTsu3.1]